MFLVLLSRKARSQRLGTYQNLPRGKHPHHSNHFSNHTRAFPGSGSQKSRITTVIRRYLLMKTQSGDTENFSAPPYKSIVCYPVLAVCDTLTTGFWIVCPKDNRADNQPCASQGVLPPEASSLRLSTAAICRSVVRQDSALFRHSISAT